jgi:hypothetical protein
MLRYYHLLDISNGPLSNMLPNLNYSCISCILIQAKCPDLFLLDFTTITIADNLVNHEVPRYAGAHVLF